jgi:hypothetical protein
VSEPTAEHDAVTDLPGAPAPPDTPVTVTAPWHNAPGTGNYTEPDVVTVRAYDKPADDGPLVAKVLEPPARPRANRGRRADAAKTASEQAGDDDQDDAEAV